MALAALFQAGKLFELVGVDPRASPAELKAACRAAQLRTHPDKGGSAEEFRITEAAVQLLLNVNPRFDGDHADPRAADLLERINYRRADLNHWETQLLGNNEAQKRLSRLLLASDVRDLQHLREEYAKMHRDHVQKREESAARVERIVEEARQEKLQSAREMKALRMRRSRAPCTRFPVLPRMVGATTRRAFTEIQSKFRKLSQTKSRYTLQHVDTTRIDSELGELMTQARSVIDTAVMDRCDTHDVQKAFPHLHRTHPKFDSLAELRKAHRRLWDRMRKNGAREDLVAKDADIIRQAWELVRDNASPS